MHRRAAGGDPALHNRPLATQGFIRFVAGGRSGTTGLYVALSCYGGSTYPWLDEVFGSDALGHIASQSGGYDNAKITAAHPSLVGLTEAHLAFWGSATVRTHEPYAGIVHR